MSAVAGPSPSVKTQGAGSSSFRCEPKRRSGPSGTALCSVLLAGAVMLAAEPRLAGAQQPSPAQAQQLLQQNPGLADVVRQRIQQSGLSAEQVRARLQASGYPANLLDAYLGGGAAAAGAQPGALELAAIQALGLPAIRADTFPVDTGMIRVRIGYGPKSVVFGVDAFRRTTTQFLPLLSGPVPPDYKLGPGDLLVLVLTGDVELPYSLQVTREGFVLIPQVGQVYVSSLTLEQLRNVLYQRLGRVYSGVKRSANATTRFDVSVANVRVNQVYVVGEVAQSGAYQISSLGTVFTALYAAGGVTDRANMRGIEVQRAGKTVATLDLYDYLLRGDTRNDVRLETGDVVFVPVHGTRAEISGAVVRPYTYELKPSETLADLIQAAGGFRPNAELRRIAVHRLLPAPDRGPGAPPRAVIDVALTPVPSPHGRREKGEVPPGDPPPASQRDVHLPSPFSREVTVVPGLASVAIPAVALQDGDSVVVDSVLALGGQYFVAIARMVTKPGMYPWREGMTLRELVLLARGPTVGAYLKDAEIARLPEDRSKGQLATTVRVPLDSSYLMERDSAGRYIGPPGLPFPGTGPGAGAPEVPLQPYDNVLILKQPEWDFQRTVVVVGEVRYPGTYSLRTKTDRLADLLERAGGLTTQAYPDGIRFVRSVGNVGRVNIDMRRALRDTSSASNIILQPGDSIEIPEYQPAVKVAGAVNSPGSVLWKKGAGLDYYLDGAGGGGQP